MKLHYYLLFLLPMLFKFNDSEKVHQLIYDLDNDDINDTIQGVLWERWGSINWIVKFGDGRVFEASSASKRIGVLPTITNGYHDLVGDLDNTMTWRNGKYE